MCITLIKASYIYGLIFENLKPVEKSLQTNQIISAFSSHQRADMAMADLTINYQREMVVDFTMPFLELGKSNIKVQIF
jgi:hypothetical protein